MDVKKVIDFDKHIKWKKLHGNNPYAMVLDAKYIWCFTQKDDPDNYTFMKLLIQDHAVNFKWGLHKQKCFKVFYHSIYAYFVAPPDIVYKAELKQNKKDNKKKTKKSFDNDKSKDRLIY
jgi:hypothetical protein